MILLVVAWLFGLDPISILSTDLSGAGAGGGALGGDPFGGSGSRGLPGGPGATVAGAPHASAREEEQVDFVSFVLDDIQQTWATLLPGYRDARLVLFRDATHSGCGVGQSEMGPFYCPTDEKVYVDLAFYDDLRSRFGAPGDFAQAYVLAHEIGHHVQRLSGIERQVREQQRANPSLANELSVRLELQADCLAGVWGHAASRRNVLEDGDIEEGLQAAAAIGDDRMQRMSGRGVHPESWTHGSSTQRQEWLHRGLTHGDPNLCNPFDA